MVHCPRCGNQNADSNKACTHCGCSLFSADSTFYLKQKEYLQEQAQENTRTAIKKIITFFVIFTIVGLLFFYFTYVFPDRAIPDPELTGTWSSPHPYIDWELTFTSDGKMNGAKYQAKDGEIITHPGSQFESRYSYQFMYATYQDGTRVKVLQITMNGTKYILHKTA